jgi:formylglycine-generating enzyme required for sulfatase activity
MDPLNFTQRLPSGLSFDMVFVEGGEYDMGGADEKAGTAEKPVHRVKVASFYLGLFPVTQNLWEVVKEDNPSRFKGPRRPVDRVSWEDAQAFIKKLNGITSGEYRLPSEAEWEYAARGGKYNEGYKYAGSDELNGVGWYDKNSGRETNEVGLLRENELGLYDMSGNVWEWCEDQWHGNYKGAPADGSAWVDRGQGTDRVYRGGGWFYSAGNCRTAIRYYWHPQGRDYYLGFRLALSYPPV